MLGKVSVLQTCRRDDAKVPGVVGLDWDRRFHVL